MERVVRSSGTGGRGNGGVELAPGFTRWLAGAGDLELARALVEEAEAFRPEALAAIAEEAAGRGLVPEALLAEERRLALAALGRDRRRRIALGLALAGLGLVPLALPKEEEIEVDVAVDNATAEEALVRLGAIEVPVAAGAVKVLRVPVARRISIVSRLLECVVRRRGELLVVGRAGDGRVLLRSRVAVHPDGRFLVAVGAARSLVCEEAQYRVRGHAAVIAEGRTRHDLAPSAGPVIDLDAVPLADGRTVAVVAVHASFPPALEEPPEPDGALASRFRLARR